MTTTPYPEQPYALPAQDKMSFQDAVKTCLIKYVDFSGRARRSEYWWFTLFFVIVYLIARILGGFVNAGSLFTGLVGLALFLPALAVIIRRLHDTNRSGWFYLISFIPLVGSIVLLVFTCLDSDTGPNRYGPCPKGSR